MCLACSLRSDQSHDMRDLQTAKTLKWFPLVTEIQKDFQFSFCFEINLFLA